MTTSATHPSEAEQIPSNQSRTRNRTWLCVHLAVHLATLLLAAIVLVRVNRDQWFFGDEREFIVNRGFDNPALSIWVPRNERWVTVPAVIYALLRNTVGSGSSWPYVGVLLIKTIDVVRDRPSAGRAPIALSALHGAAGLHLLARVGRRDSAVSRYVCTAMTLALPGLTLALSNLAKPIWSQSVVAPGLGIVLVVNVNLLVERSITEAQREKLIKSNILVVTDLVAAGEPILDVRPDPVLDPGITSDGPAKLIAQGAMPTGPVTELDIASARLRMVVFPDATSGNVVDGSPSDLQSGADASTEDVPRPTSGESCLRSAATGGDPHLLLVVPGGKSNLSVTTPQAGGPCSLSLEDAPADAKRGVLIGRSGTRLLQTELPAGTRLRLTVPVGESVVCGLPPGAAR